MSAEKRFFCPEILIPNVEATRVYIEGTRLASIYSNLPEPLVELSSKNSVNDSLDSFIQRIEEILVNSFMKVYRKQGKVEPEGNFTLTVIHKHGWTKDLSSDFSCGRFFVDGEHGLQLGFQTPDNAKPLWLAVTSFSCGTEIFGYASDYFIGTSKEGRAAISKLKYPYPIIVQLQGQEERNTYGQWNRESDRATIGGNYYRASNILQSYKWEKALINLLIDWAIEQRIPGICLLPAKFNMYVTPDEIEKFERFQMIYDFTARKCGLKMQESGIYGLSLISVSRIGEPSTIPKSPLP